jgi:hypothetical protein
MVLTKQDSFRQWRQCSINGESESFVLEIQLLDWIGSTCRIARIGLDQHADPASSRVPVSSSYFFRYIDIQEDSEDHSLLDVNVRATECSRDETRYVLWILYLAGSTFIPIVFQRAKWNTFGVICSKILFGTNEINSIRG